MRFKFLILVATLFIFFISSEIFYNNIHNTPRLVSYYLQLSKFNSSLFFSSFLQNAIKVRIERNEKIYSDYEYKSDSHKLNFRELEIYSKDSRKYLENELPLTLYNLAVASFESGNETDFTELLEKSILVDPDLSFSYVELANYYFYKGQEESAQKVLERCLGRMYPQNHCDSYIRDREIHNSYSNIGFLKNAINKYFEDLNN